jgi:uncharacterized protein (DUF305 family)
MGGCGSARGPGRWLGLAAALAVLANVAPPTPAQAQATPMHPCSGTGPMALGSADAHFIRMMIPHHEGAIAMADVALQRSGRAEIRALAQRIRTSQSQENTQMRRWYGQWFGGPVPPWPGRGQGMGMGMGMGTNLQGLREATDVDRAFLQQMISHHRMGVMMASHAQWGTVHPELRELEAAMVRVQSEEIGQMERWYREWFGPGGP